MIKKSEIWTSTITWKNWTNFTCCSPTEWSLWCKWVQKFSLHLIKVWKLCNVQDLSAVLETKCICSGTQVRFWGTCCPPPLHITWKCDLIVNQREWQKRKEGSKVINENQLSVIFLCNLYVQIVYLLMADANSFYSPLLPHRLTVSSDPRRMCWFLDR